MNIVITVIIIISSIIILLLIIIITIITAASNPASRRATRYHDYLLRPAVLVVSGSDLRATGFTTVSFQNFMFVFAAQTLAIRNLRQYGQLRNIFAFRI